VSFWIPEEIKRLEFLKLKNYPKCCSCSRGKCKYDLAFKSQNHVTSYDVSLQKLKIIQEVTLLPKVGFTIDRLFIDVESKEEKTDQVSHSESDTLVQRFPFHLIHEYQTANRPNPSGKKTFFSISNTTILPAVLILKNMEGFTTKVLQDFIIISSRHQLEFLLILVSGIAKSTIIHWLLPHAVSLLIELFQFLSHRSSKPQHSVFCGVISQNPRELASLSENQCENIRLSSFRYVEKKL
ncbi:hypothetical protein EI555_018888, partial [Monodon monoceros]